MEPKIIRVIQGDITESNADAIVNAANNHLWMGSGVAGAIKRKGGSIIEKEAMAQGPISVGEAVATTAGELPNKYIIHAAAMGQDLITNESLIAQATRNSLALAEKLNLKSIDFPALGTGVGGFPVDKAAKIMVQTARDFLISSSSVCAVGFVLFDIHSYNIFLTETGGKHVAV